MNEDNKKYITVSFVAASILLALTMNLMMEFLASQSASIARLESNPELSNGLPVAIGIIVFIVLQFNKITVDYMDQVIGELRKVVWPSRRDTGLMTVVVVITLIISGVVVGVYDSVWAFLINHLVKL